MTLLLYFDSVVKKISLYYCCKMLNLQYSIMINSSASCCFIKGPFCTTNILHTWNTQDGISYKTSRSLNNRCSVFDQKLFLITRCVPCTNHTCDCIIILIKIHRNTISMISKRFIYIYIYIYILHIINLLCYYFAA